jgi:hypothetical protein
MRELREREGIMASRAPQPNPRQWTTELFNGLYTEDAYTRFVDG